MIKMYRLQTFKVIVIFCFSCILGALFALIWRKYLLAVHISAVMKNYGLINLISRYNTHDYEYIAWLQSHGLDREPYSKDWRESLLLCDKSLQLPGEPTTEACSLRDLVPVICVVLSTSETLDYARAIKGTWGAHCNKIVIFAPDESQKSWTISVIINDSPAMKLTWSMLCQALFYSYVEFESQYPWFFIITDETFAIPENLRYLLAIYNASQPYYFGHSYKKGDDIYNTLQGGIVLSRAALKLLHENVSLHSTCSKQKMQKGDVILSHLLKKVDVFATDTRDNLGRGLFNMFEPEMHLIPGAINWFHTDHFYRSLHLSLDGADCCSDHAITFHTSSKEEMYVLYYLIYRLTPYGSHRLSKKQISPTHLSTKVPSTHKKNKTVFRKYFKKSYKKNKESAFTVDMSESLRTNEIPNSKKLDDISVDDYIYQSLLPQNLVDDNIVATVDVQLNVSAIKGVLRSKNNP